MTDTTQPHPEPSEEPVVAYRHLVEGHGWMHTGGSLLTGEQVIRAMGGVVTRSEALTPLADAQSQLNAMRVERDKWYQEAAAQAASAIAVHDELEALKAAPVVDVERIMALAEVWATTAKDDAYDRRWGDSTDTLAAREALRAALASPEGSPR